MFEAPGPARGRSAGAAGAGPAASANVHFETVLPFAGGVTLDWVTARIRDWEAVLAHFRRLGRRAALHALPAQETIH